MGELESLQAGLESRCQTLESENLTLKEFRSDLSAVNDLVCEEMQLEISTLKANRTALQNEAKCLKSDLSKVKTSKGFLSNELSIAKNEIEALSLEVAMLKKDNASYFQKLNEALERIKLFEKDVENCLKHHSASSLEFDFGIDQLLDAPQDVLGIQIDNLDMNHFGKMEELEHVGECSKITSENESEQKSTSEDDCDLPSFQPVFEEAQGTSKGEKIVWSDEEFDYDLLNDSLESNHQLNPADKLNLPLECHLPGCDCIDCDVLSVNRQEVTY